MQRSPDERWIAGRRGADRRGERGVVAVLAAILLLLIGAFTALVINSGFMFDARAELQGGSDSAALAAAKSLNGISSGLTTARTMAENYSNAHMAINQKILINKDSSDVTFGAWHFSAGKCFFDTSTDCATGFEEAPGSPTTSDIMKITTVQVFNGRDDDADHNPAVARYMGYFLGSHASMKVRSNAIAVGPGASVDDCALPFVIPLCDVECGVAKRRFFSSSGRDFIGFINLGDSNNAPNPGTLSSLILNACSTTTPRTVGDYKMGEGSSFTDNEVIPALFGLERKGSKYNKVGDCMLGVERVFPTIDDASCASFSGTEAVVRFISATIESLTNNSGDCYTAAHCPTSYAVGAEVPWPPTPDASCKVTGGGGSKRSMSVNVACGGGGELELPEASVVWRLVQ